MVVRLSNTRKAYSRIKVVVLTEFHCNKNDDNNDNHNYIKILESDWSSAGLISAVIVQLYTSCACNCTVVRVMPE